MDRSKSFDDELLKAVQGLSLVLRLISFIFFRQKNKYIQQMRGNELPAVRRTWTQTTEPVILLSDTCDDDSDDDGSDRADGKGNKRGRKKRKRFRVFNKKLDFSKVKSRTDSNYKDGKVMPVDKSGVGNKSAPDGTGGKLSRIEEKGNLPLVYIDSGKPTNHDADVSNLKKLLEEVRFINNDYFLSLFSNKVAND